MKDPKLQAKRRQNSDDTRARVISGVLLTLTAASYLWIALGICTPLSLFEPSGWPAALLLVFTAITAIHAESRVLPLQNVLLAAAVIGLLTGLAHAINVFTNLPFGPVVYSAASDPKLFGTIPWSVPLITTAFILLSRGVARLILIPRRGMPNYGLSMIALTVALTIPLDICAELFATRVVQMWRWEPAHLPFILKGIPLMRVAGGAVMTLLIVVLITPLLIRKHPAQPAPRYTPLIIWFAIILLSALALKPVL